MSTITYGEDEKSTLVFKENKAKTDIYTVEARSLLNKATGFMSAYDFTLNPYRGCQMALLRVRSQKSGKN